jgi:hypothetical protein
VFFLVHDNVLGPSPDRDVYGGGYVLLVFFLSYGVTMIYMRYTGRWYDDDDEEEVTEL